jgi:hypothetical protein
MSLAYRNKNFRLAPWAKAPAQRTLDDRIGKTDFCIVFQFVRGFSHGLIGIGARYLCESDTLLQ